MDFRWMRGLHVEITLWGKKKNSCKLYDTITVYFYITIFLEFDKVLWTERVNYSYEYYSSKLASL